MEKFDELNKYEAEESSEKAIDIEAIEQNFNDTEVALFENRKKTFLSKVSSLFGKKSRIIFVIGAMSVAFGPSLKEKLEDEACNKKLKDYISSFENDPEYRYLKNEISRFIGEENLYRVESFSFINNEFYGKDNESRNISIGAYKIGEDFEKTLKTIIGANNQFLPENITNEISVIEFLDEEQGIPEEYGPEFENSRRSGTCHTYHISINKNDLKDSDPESYRHAFATIFHEMIHANDWYRDQEMSSRERLELLYEVTKRLKSDDRFMSDYVESIKNDNIHDENDIKSIEYIAEIGEQYFMNPKNLKENYPKDFEIVDSLIKKHDSNFDVFAFEEKFDEVVPETKAYDNYTHASYSYDSDFVKENNIAEDNPEISDNEVAQSEVKTEANFDNEERLREIESMNIFSSSSASRGGVKINQSKKY